MLIVPTAVFFDMDGTLTEPLLDFPRLKAEMGVGERPILEALAEMTVEERSAAEAILHRYEERAAASSTLNDGCRELLALLKDHGIPTALITRNSRLSVRTVLGMHGLRFDVLVTREDGRFKPDPQPLLLAARNLGVEAGRVWMVGDGQYDVEAALAAGARAVWLSHGRQRPFAAEPWLTVADLPQLTSVLKDCLP